MRNRFPAIIVLVTFGWQQISWAGEIGIVPLNKQDDKIPQAQPVNQIQAAQFQAGAAVAQQEIEGARGVVQPALTDLDVVGPGVIDRADVEKIVSQMGQTGVGLVGDVNQDGVVDIFDVILVSLEVGKDTKQAWREKRVNNLRTEITQKISKLQVGTNLVELKRAVDAIRIPLLFEANDISDTDRKELGAFIDNQVKPILEKSFDLFIPTVRQTLKAELSDEELLKKKEAFISEINAIDPNLYFTQELKDKLQKDLQRLRNEVNEQFGFVTTKPQLTSLPPVIKETKVQLGWKEVSKATAYEIEFTEEGKPLKILPLVTGTLTELAELKDLTNYTIRLRAKNGDVVSRWSESRQFRVVIPPKPLHVSRLPAKVTETSYTVKWDAVADAKDGYELEVAVVGGTPTVIVVTPEEYAKISGHVLKGLKDLTDYTLRVRAKKEGVFGEWSEMRQFRVVIPPRAPLVTAPPEKVNERNHTIQWEVVTDAKDGYELELSTDPNFSQANTTRDTSIKGTNKTLKGLSDLTTYYVRVRGKKEGLTGDWSEVKQFRVVLPPQAPVVIPPPAKVNETSHTIQWGAVGDAKDGYEVELTAGSGLVTTRILTPAEYAKTSGYELKGLKDLTDYQVRVRAKKEGVWGEWSKPVTFRVVLPPSAPVVNVPPAKVTEASYTIKWIGVADAKDEYELEITSGSEAPKVIAVPLKDVIKDIVEVAYRLDGLKDLTNYTIRVRTKKEGITGAWSEPVKFKVVIPPAAPTWVTKVDPVITESEKEFIWQGEGGIKAEVTKNGAPYLNFELKQVEKKILIKGMSDGGYVVKLWATKDGVEGAKAELRFKVQLVDFWIEKLTKSQDPSERAKAAEKLGQIGDPKALPALINALGDHPIVNFTFYLSEFEVLTYRLLREYIPEEFYRGTDIKLVIKDSKGKEIAFNEMRITERMASGPTYPENAIEVLLKPGIFRAELYIKQNGSLKLYEATDFAVQQTAGGWLEIKNSSIGAWRTAREALVKIGVEAGNSLIAALGHSKPGVRKGTANVLGKMKFRPAVEGLKERATKDNIAPVREEAIYALDEIGDPKAVTVIVEALGDQDSSVSFAADKALRGEVATRLRELKDTREVEKLLELLKSHLVINVRTEAIRTLGKIGDLRAIPVLIEKLADTEYRIRSSVSDALFYFIRDVFIYETPPDVVNEISNALKQALSHPNSKVRSELMTLLGRIRRETTDEQWIQILQIDPIERLIQVLQKDEDPSVRTSAALALGEIGDPKAIPTLIEALADYTAINGSSFIPLGKNTEEFRLWINKVFLPSESYGKDAVLIVKDPDGKEFTSKKIRINGKWEFNFEFPEITAKEGRYLVELYLDENGVRKKLQTQEFTLKQSGFGFHSVEASKRGARDSAIDALQKIGTQSGGALVGALDHVKPSIRHGALTVIGYMRYLPAQQKVREVLKNDEVPSIRLIAVWFLRDLKDFQTIVEALGDKDKNVWWQARQAMKNNKTLTLEIVKQALKTHPNVQVRAEAALILGDWNIQDEADDVLLTLISGSQNADADKKEEYLSKVVDFARQWNRKEFVAEKMSLSGIRRDVYLLHNILLVDTTEKFNEMELTRIQEVLNLLPKHLVQRLGLKIISRLRPEDAPVYGSRKLEAVSIPFANTIQFFVSGSVNVGVIAHEMMHVLFETLTEQEKKERSQLYVDSKMAPDPRNIVTAYAREQGVVEDYPETITVWIVDSVELLKQVAEDSLSKLKEKLFHDLKPFVYRGSDGIERVSLYRAGEGYSALWGAKQGWVPIGTWIPDTVALSIRQDIEGIVHRDANQNIIRIEIRPK